MLTELAQTNLEQELAKWVGDDHVHKAPPNEALLIFFESACGLVVVPLLLDITARYTDWVKHRTLEFTGAYGIMLMLLMWMALSRDTAMIADYGARGLAIAYTTTLLHQKTKPASWEPQPDEETTAVQDVRRWMRGKK